MQREGLAIGRIVRPIAVGLASLGAFAGASSAGQAAAPKVLPHRSPPPIKTIASRSQAALRAVRAAHSEADISTWSHLPKRSVQQLAVHLTADCSTTVTLTQLGGWQRIRIHGTSSSGSHHTAVDTRWIFHGYSGPNGGRSRYTFWERSGRTGGRWRLIPSSKVVQEPEYAATLASGGLCGASFTRVVPVSSYRYLGEMTVGGQPGWRLRGQHAAGGERFDQELTVDERTFLVHSQTLIYREQVGGRDVARWRSVDNYSAFNRPVGIAAPRLGSTTP